MNRSMIIEFDNKSRNAVLEGLEAVRKTFFKKHVKKTYENFADKHLFGRAKKAGFGWHIELNEHRIIPRLRVNIPEIEDNDCFIDGLLDGLLESIIDIDFTNLQDLTKRIERRLKKIFGLEPEKYFQTAHQELPIKYKTHRYIDIISTLKKLFNNISQGMLNSIKSIRYENETRFRYNYILN